MGDGHFGKDLYKDLYRDPDNTVNRHSEGNLCT